MFPIWCFFSLLGVVEMKTMGLVQLPPAHDSCCPDPFQALRLNVPWVVLHLAQHELGRSSTISHVSFQMQRPQDSHGTPSGSLPATPEWHHLFLLPSIDLHALKDASQLACTLA